MLHSGVNSLYTQLHLQMTSLYCLSLSVLKLHILYLFEILIFFELQLGLVSGPPASIWSFLSAPAGVISVGTLPRIMDHDPSQCGPPKGASSLSQASLPNQAS